MSHNNYQSTAPSKESSSANHHPSRHPKNPIRNHQSLSSESKTDYGDDDDEAVPAHNEPLTNESIIPLGTAVERARAARARLATAHEALCVLAQALVEAGAIRAAPLSPASYPPPSSNDPPPSSDNYGTREETACALTREMGEFAAAVSARYAAARFLWEVLRDVDEEREWFGKGRKFDDSVRRVKVLKGLEGSLRWWEGVLLRLVELVEEFAEDVDAEEDGGEQRGKEMVVEEEGEEEGEDEGKKRWSDGNPKADEVKVEQLRRDVQKTLSVWRRGVPSRP